MPRYSGTVYLVLLALHWYNKIDTIQSICGNLTGVVFWYDEAWTLSGLLYAAALQRKKKKKKRYFRAFEKWKIPYNTDGKIGDSENRPSTLTQRVLAQPWGQPKLSKKYQWLLAVHTFLISVSFLGEGNSALERAGAERDHI